MDYRKFLKDWYTQAKKERSSFSFRVFSKRAGFESPNFFKLVMDGKRNLTAKSLPKFIVGLKLNKQEQEFFQSLVAYTQASTHEEKDEHYRKLLQSKKFNKIKPVDKDCYDFYGHWYHSVVRELVTHKDFDGSPDWVANRVFPPINAKQVEKSIELLEKLGFIEKTSNKRYKQTDSLLTTGDELAALVFLNYHQNMLALTKQTLPYVSAKRRDVSSLTLGVSRERVDQIKLKIKEFRKEILKLVADDKEPEEVVFVNIQMLPATKESV